uniref:response regulator n=1 Tax=Dactylococcopsis salina TaxID=292566 RepID=UPI0002F63AC1
MSLNFKDSRSIHYGNWTSIYWNYQSDECSIGCYRKKPDLIFLDLVMPILNGYELCSKIRQVKSMNSVPIVILTGNLTLSLLNLS